MDIQESMDALTSPNIEFLRMTSFNEATLLICVITSLVLCIAIHARREKTKSSFWLQVLLLSDAVSMLAECLSLLLMYRLPHTYIRILDSLAVVTTYLSMCCIHWYVCAFLDEKGVRTYRYSYARYWVFVWMLISAAVLFVPDLIDEIVVYDEYGAYQYTSLYTLVTFISCGPLWVADLVLLLRSWKKMTGRERRYLLWFHGLLIPAVLVDSTYMTYSISFVMTTMILLLYVFLTVDREALMAHKDAQLTEQRAQIMLSQIQPHFLYNALNAIGYLCGEDASRARKTLDDFADYLRMNMESLTTREPAPFSVELEHTRTYLNIEQMRFGDDLKVVYDIGCDDFFVPPLSLQPLVENAVKHGVCHKEYGGTVTIATRRQDGKVYVTVSDDGAGFDVEAVREDGQTHVGIENVRSRLETMCGGKLEIRSTIGQGTVATIILEG